MRSFVKAIAGIGNQDVEQVALLARVAQASGVQALDVSADLACVRVARRAFHGQLFASAVSAQALLNAVDAGADVAELGNYDDLYAQGEWVSAQDVMHLAQETLDVLGGKAPLCVTIPGHLSREAQVEMLYALADMGVAMIQSEGAIRLLDGEQVQVLTAEEKALLSLENARVLSKEGRLPVMVASGISSHNADLAMQTGAVAIGIGKAFNALSSESEMLNELKACQMAIQQNEQAIA